MDLFDKVSEDIKNAMKAKDKVALETLRNVIGSNFLVLLSTITVAIASGNNVDYFR